MKHSIYCIAAGMLIMSCSKENGSTNQNPQGANDLGQLTISQDFNWSSSIKGKTIVTLDAPENFQSEGQDIYIVDENGQRLSHQKIMAEQASFFVSVPQANEKYYALLPATGDRVEVKGPGNVKLTVHADFENDYEGMIGNFKSNDGKKSVQKTTFTGQEMLVNGNFSTNNFPAYGSSVTTGVWYKFDYNYDWKLVGGSRVIAAKSGKITTMYQGWICTPGDSFTLSADAYASANDKASVGVIFFDSNFSMISYAGVAASQGTSSLSLSGVVPNNAVTGAVAISAYNLSWLDNVSVLEGPAITDADNDGVADGDDQFPNDPSRAYTASFPTLGYQTLAFEDLWPAQGDYDFNDMVVSTQIEYTTNAANNLVDATVTISLDAMGAGNSNGLALRLLDENNQPFSNSIIASISGNATADPGNTNGVIVFNDAKAAQSEYYTNNGAGPDKQPDVFTFTITFNANAGSQNIVPDIYIYRTDDRGREIHLDGFSGSAAANTAYYNTYKDYQGTYNTANGLPWAIEVITANKSYKHPMEKVNILVAYPQFQIWAESNGVNAQNWLLNPATGKIFEIL